MTEALPGTDPLALPARPWRTVYLVTDAFDEVNLTPRLAALESAQCVVVRPNPVRSASDLVWDVLTAAGKNPAAARTNRLTIDSAWAAAAAWLAAARTAHIVVERGHRLSEKEAVRLAELADTVDATLWLIWCSPRDATKMGNALESLGHSRLHCRRGRLPSGGPNRPLRAIYLDGFYCLLPLPDPATSLAPNADENPDPDDDWPALPDADFPLFLAICRRLAAPRSGDFARGLNAYLRDERLSPPPAPASPSSASAPSRPPSSAEASSCAGSPPASAPTRRAACRPGSPPQSAGPARHRPHRGGGRHRPGPAPLSRPRPVLPPAVPPLQELSEVVGGEQAASVCEGAQDGRTRMGPPLRHGKTASRKRLADHA
ncbi:hypothetical protein [Streptomyces sp. DSM 40907]|uniref:hypothetical protein n=1 Tax=Streptomyces kutzneri TaxID=3051179 RepID=UPI0028D13C1E|nr:hypothetical protein [Streptomyces sp. DSM 40907]